MKRLWIIMMLSAFCFSASAINVPWQDTTRTRQDTTKKNTNKKPVDKQKMKKKSGSKKEKDTLGKNDRRRDTTTRTSTNY